MWREVLSFLKALGTAGSVLELSLMLQMLMPSYLCDYILNIIFILFYSFQKKESNYVIAVLLYF